ncbi:hypothetical protein [Lactobacillus johnsonii]|uniref:hypothetical protein n=1 Tax=Lactobacillus johnsonii TaxID=33959 RepID=UPI002550134B|nr:hypothetical protein [Lactobacillus johnsonii]
MAEKIEEYKNLLSLSYEDAVESLLQKYGPVIDDYFREKSYNRFFNGEIKSITKGKFTKTSEGLYCHHVFENKYYNLTNKDFCKEQNAPYEVHKKENLVYCDLIEHFILHILITKETNGKFGWPGVRTYLLNNLVEWYVVCVNIPTEKWRLFCYKKAKLSKNEITTLFMEVKKVLPSSLQPKFEKLYKDAKYACEHEEELNREYEDRSIRIAYNGIAKSLFTNNVEKMELEIIENMRNDPSERLRKAANDIIGQWLILKINDVIKAKDRQLNPKKYAVLDKLAFFEQMRAEEHEEELRKIALQNFYLEFHKKYPNLQNIDVEPDISREKIMTLLYRMYYNTKFKSKKEYKIASINMLRDDLLVELNDRLK